MNSVVNEVIKSIKWFRSVVVSTWDFDSHIPGSSPGGTWNSS